MKRTLWNFPYPAGKLLEAAKAKRDMAQSRIEFWQKKKDETMASIREHGLTIDESLALEKNGSFSSNAYRGPAVSIDDTLLRDLNECVQKLAEHRSKKIDYLGWIEVLTSQGDTMFELNQDDWLFFFSKPQIEVNPELA